MPEPRSRFPFVGLLSLATSIFWLSLPGCDQAEKIQKYSVPNHNAIQTKEFLASEEARHPTPVPRRMIGVIIPKQTSFWFFKLEGDVVAVASREAEVRDFVKTVHFPDPKKPDEIEWQAPEKWNRLPPTPLRYATLVLDGAPKLEISVTTLPVQPDQELNDQILANINRWRGQLSLDPIKLSELDLEAEKIAISDSTAYWVSLAGWALPKTNTMPPGHPPAAGPADSQPRKETPRADDRAPGSHLKYEKPAEWEEAPATVFSKVSLQVSDGDKKVAVTVTPSRGTTVDNVNRWRNQLMLESQSPDELMASAKKVSVGNLPGNLFELKNGDRSIYGVIVEMGDILWFVKLDGNTALAERERPRFETFVKSLQLN